MNGQLQTFGKSGGLAWVGYSYFSFRLLHTIIDRKRLSDLNLTLKEYFTYLVFFPAYIAGPIDRLEHFLPANCEAKIPPIIKKIFWMDCLELRAGLFFKFVLADNLALFSLMPNRLIKSRVRFWAWIIVYAYAFRIFFDFAGYTDIAIGLGRLAGIQLPENFNRPYLIQEYHYVLE